jgi:hypothetical protein
MTCRFAIFCAGGFSGLALWAAISKEPWFEEITHAAGVFAKHSNRVFDNPYAKNMAGYTALGASVAVADFDGDGFDDVYIIDSSERCKNHLYRNNHALPFTDGGEQAGVANGNDSRNASAAALWFDFGGAPLGASAANGEYFPAEHHEYVRIPRRALAPRDRALEVRITEELHEVSYLDQVRLLPIDHPSEVELYTNGKFKSPPFPEFRLFGVKRRVYPTSARDQDQRDVLEKVLQRDGRYADSFPCRLNGTANLHQLDLDFGNAAPSNRAVLFLNGWVDWAVAAHSLRLPRRNRADC